VCGGSVSSGGRCRRQQRRRSSGGAAAEQRRRSSGGGAAAAAASEAAAAHPLFAGLGEHHPALRPPHLRCISFSFAAPTPLSTLTPFRAPRASVATVGLSQALCCATAPLVPLALFHAPRTSVAGCFRRASRASVAVLSLSRPTRLYCLLLPFAPPAPLSPLALFARPPPRFFCRSFTGSHSSVACRSLSRPPVPLSPLALFRGSRASVAIRYLLRPLHASVASRFLSPPPLAYLLPLAHSGGGRGDSVDTAAQATPPQ
jgi:hypothetical protein